MADVTECPNHRLHVVAVLSSAFSKIANDTASEMISAGFSADDDDLEPFSEWIHGWVDEAIGRGWWAR